MHRENFDSQKIKIVDTVSLLMAFGQSLIIYFLSSYFKLITGSEERIGFFYILAYLVVVVVLLNWHKVIRRIGKAPVFIFSVLAKVIVLTTLVFLGPTWLALIPLMLYLVFGALEWTSLDIILESYSQDKLSGRIRGIHLTIFNLGFIFGPLISAYILKLYDYHGLFLSLLLLNIVIFILALVGLRKVNHRYDRDLEIREIFQKLRKRKNVLRILYISLTLDMFFALMIIYTPLYLEDIGYQIESIGWIFTVMLIPFVLLQFPVGYLADRKLGEKEMIVVSLILMAFSTMLLLATGRQTAAVWAALLFFTRIGAAMLEVLRDSYFYKRIDGYDVDMIDIYRSMMPLGYVIANLMAIPLLLFFPVKFVFFIVVAVVLSALYPAAKLKDNLAECEQEKVA